MRGIYTTLYTALALPILACLRHEWMVEYTCKCHEFEAQINGSILVASLGFRWRMCEWHGAPDIRVSQLQPMKGVRWETSFVLFAKTTHTHSHVGVGHDSPLGVCKSRKLQTKLLLFAPPLLAFNLSPPEFQSVSASTMPATSMRFRCDCVNVRELARSSIVCRTTHNSQLVTSHTTCHAMLDCSTFIVYSCSLLMSVLMLYYNTRTHVVWNFTLDYPVSRRIREK